MVYYIKRRNRTEELPEKHKATPYTLVMWRVFNFKKKAKTASSKIAEQTTGYPTGGIPPIGHRNPLRTVIDPLVLENEFILAGGGTRKKMVKLKPTDILRLSKAFVKDITVKYDEQDYNDK